MNKKYTMTFTMDDGTTKTVNFELPVAVVNASEVKCTGWTVQSYETKSQDFIITTRSHYPQYRSDIYTINFTKPVGELQFSISEVTIPDGAWKYTLSEDKMSATISYQSDSAMLNTGTGAVILNGTVTIKAYHALTNVEDCLNWLKNN